LGVGTGSIDLNSAPARQSLSTALYLQDDIKVNARLTINAGLRWDYTGPMTDRYNAMTGAFAANEASPLQPPDFRQLTGGLTFPGVGGQPRNVYDAAHTNFGPRLGFAYSLDQKTALRGGWGIFYGPIWYDPGSAGFSQSTPWVTYDANLIPLNLLANPFPSGLIAPVGASQGLATNIGTGITFIDPHTREPRSQQFSFEIQRELPWGIRASAGYVLNKVDRLPVTKDLNAWTLDQLPLGAAGLNQHVANPFAGLVPGYSLNQATITYGQLIRPFPQFTTVVEQNIPIGSSRYDGWSSINGNLRRPPVHNFDLGITKNNRITERVNFQIMGLFINAFNTPQFWDGPSNCSSPAQNCFGQIAGYNTQSNLPRQVQLAGRVTF
jgi:TonB dependent receptor-like, beta-barrel